MKKSLPIIAAAILNFTAPGCYKMKIDAPLHSGNYVLGSKEQQSVTRVKRRCWYLFWGLLPVSDNSSGEIIKRLPTGYRVIRAQTSLDTVSFFVFFFTLGIVSSSSIIVEGVGPPMPPGEDEVKPIEPSLPP